MPLERHTLNTLSLRALHIAPGQDTGDNNSKASNLCSENCVLGRRAFKGIKETGTAGLRSDPFPKPPEWCSKSLFRDPQG